MNTINGAIAAVFIAGTLGTSFGAAAQSYTSDIKDKMINAQAMDQCLFENKKLIDLEKVDELVAQGWDEVVAGYQIEKDNVDAALRDCEEKYQFTEDDYTLPFCPVEPLLIGYPLILKI